MWCYGLLVLNVMTDYYFVRQIGDDCICIAFIWRSKIKQVFKKILQELHFNDEFDKAFALIFVSEENKMHAFDFVKSLLKTDSDERQTAAEALSHPFLKVVIQNDARDFFDSEGFVDNTNLYKCKEASAELKSINNNDKSYPAAESYVSLVFLARSREDARATLKYKQIKGKVKLKHENTKTELWNVGLNDNLLVTDIKEQNPDVTLHVTLNSVSWSTVDVERKSL